MRKLGGGSPDKFTRQLCCGFVFLFHMCTPQPPASFHETISFPRMRSPVTIGLNCTTVAAIYDDKKDCKCRWPTTTFLTEVKPGRSENLECDIKRAEVSNFGSSKVVILLIGPKFL